MKRFTLLLLSLAMSTGLFAQLNIQQLGQLGYTQELSDIWGYADQTGNEYALVGVFNGFSIVDVTDPTTPNELFFVPGANSTWRDMKEWNGYAYVTNESSGGLLIVNLNYLPDSIQTFNAFPLGMSSAHNIFIDENGVGYVVGADVGNGGCIFIDCDANPTNPPVLGHYTNFYIHDLFARGDTMWAANINNGFFTVVDVSDKNNTNAANKELARQNTPSNFTHNTWLSDDGQYLYTTDEVSNAFIGSYDVSDLNNIFEADRIQSNPGTGTIVHNTFFLNDFLVTSYYRDGVTIHDATYGDNLIEVGNFDTSPNFQGNGFNGAWGVYPYLPSGNILATDIEEGLYVLGPDYIHACFLEGIVSDTTNGNPIVGATVELVATPNTEQTGLAGDYQTGILDSGMYSVSFSATGYITKTIHNVHLTNGVLTTLDAELVPSVPFTLTGQVIDSITSNPVPFAHVLLTSTTSTTTYDFQADGSGNFSVNNVFSDEYDIVVGQWGYYTKGFEDVVLHIGSGPQTFELTPGYYDDFIFDFSWSTTSTASSGDWEKGEPEGTTFQGNDSNTDFDVNDDFGDECYVTGNGGGTAGNDDVDNGVVTLISPSFDLSTYEDPQIDFEWWFFNDGGQGNPNDELEVVLTNGMTSATVLLVNSNHPQQSMWNHHTLRVKDFMTPSATMNISFETEDQQQTGHLVEAAVDRFLVWDTPDTICDAVIANADMLSIGFTIDCIDTVEVLSNDINQESDSLTVTIVTGPTTGSAVVLSDGTIQFTSGGVANTTETIVYESCNGCGSCDTSTITVQISSMSCTPNSAPVIVDDNGLSTEDAQFDVFESITEELCVHVNEPDGDNLIGTIISGPSHGLATVSNDSCIMYTSNVNYNGPDSVWLEICDDGNPQLCDTVLVLINVKLYGGLDLADKNAIQLFPNPASEYVEVRMSDMNGLEQISLINAVGQVVQTASNGHNILNLKDVSAGMYTVEVKFESGVISKQLIVID